MKEHTKQHYKVATQQSTTKEHHKEELETRPSQDKDQPEWTTRVWQSSKPAGERRTKMKMGASQLIFSQCMARRQPRQHLNYCQWEGRFITFHIIAMANVIMVWSFHLITSSTLTCIISNIIMSIFNHKNKHHIAIYLNYILSMLTLARGVNIHQ